MLKILCVTRYLYNLQIVSGCKVMVPVFKYNSFIYTEQSYRKKQNNPKMNQIKGSQRLSGKRRWGCVRSEGGVPQFGG